MNEFSLIIVDMINAYLAPGGKLYCKEAHAIIPAINRLVRHVRTEGGTIIFANTSLASEQDPIARKWGMHAVQGTESTEPWHELSREDNDRVVEKTSYNAFFRTNLNEVLRSANASSVGIVGIHTHVCVLLTAAMASDLGYEVVTFRDAMTTGYRPNHDTRLRFFETHIGRLTKVNDFIRSDR